MSAGTVAPDEAVAPTRRSRRLVRMFIVVAVVLAAASAVWLLVLAPDAGADDGPLVEGEIVLLEPQTTTLGEAQLQHARVALGVVLVEGVDPTVIPPRAALLRDALLRELATMDADQVRSAEGSDELRTRLSEAARGIWSDEQVIRVVLTELLVQ